MKCLKLQPTLSYSLILTHHRHYSREGIRRESAMFSPVRLEVEGYENELMPVFRSCLKSAYADF